jgi:hypothetical protein
MADFVRRCRKDASPEAEERWDQAMAIAQKILEDNPEVKGRIDGRYEVYIALKAERKGTPSQLAGEALNNDGGWVMPDQLSDAANATGVPLTPRQAAHEVQRGLKLLGAENLQRTGTRNPNIDHFGESDESFLRRAGKILREARQQQPGPPGGATQADTLPLPGTSTPAPRGRVVDLGNGVTIEYPPYL